MLKELLKVRRQGGYIVPRINEFLLTHQEDDSERAQGVFHPSEIAADDWCSRQWCFQQMHPDVRREVPPHLRRIFDLGTAVHRLYQTYATQMGILYGRWVCQHGSETWGLPPSADCPNATTSCRWSYREMQVRDEQFNVLGHTDGILVPDPDAGPRVKYGWEIKTINASGFTSLRKPLVRHRNQGWLYLWVQESTMEQRAVTLGAAGFSEAAKIERLPFTGYIVMYINKDGGEHDLKEYLITKDKDYLTFIEGKKRILQTALGWAFASDPLPDRVCKTLAEGQKRRCPFAKECFSDEYV